METSQMTAEMFIESQLACFAVHRRPYIHRLVIEERSDAE